MREASMSLWQSPAGRLHWLRACSGGPGRHRMTRVAVSRARFAQAQEDSKVCRCLRVTEFVPGKKAR